MKLESRMQAPGPVRLTLLLLSLPSILMGLTWGTIVFYGFTDAPNVRQMREFLYDAMTVILIGAFVSLVIALLIGPILFGAVRWQWRKTAASVAVLSGVGAGAWAYRHVELHGVPALPVPVMTVIGDSLAPLASLAAFVVASLLAVSLMRLVAPRRRSRWA